MLGLPFHLFPTYFGRAGKSVAHFDTEPDPGAALPDDAIILAGCVRDERLRIGPFLDHYRRIGVDRFALVDNGSTDGTAEFLAGERDVWLYRTTQSYSVASCGQAWIDAMLDRHGRDRWCLVADADELLVYPGFPDIGLRDLARYHDARGFTAMPSVLLDMYAETLWPTTDAKGTLWDLCPYYDSDGIRVATRILLDRRQDRLMGGFRRRVLQTSVILNKIAIFRHAAGVRISQGNHAILGARCSDLRAVHVHFKFLADFRDRVIREAERGEHWNDAAEYRAYANAMAALQGRAVLYAGSRRWAGVDPLLRHGIMRTSTRFEQFMRRYAVPAG